MRPELFRLGRFVVPSYSALLALGLIPGLALAAWYARRRGLSLAFLLDGWLVAGLGALVGGRALHVLVHLPYYRSYPQRIARISQGGLAWQGALVGGAMATALLSGLLRSSLVHRQTSQQTPDANARTLLGLLAWTPAVTAPFAWLACLLHSCVWGRETYPIDGLLWSISLDLPDLYGTWAPRAPVQLLGAAWGLLTLALLWLTSRRAEDADRRLPRWLGLTCCGSLALSVLRGDEATQLWGLRVDQVIDGALLIAALAWLTIARLRERAKPAEADVP